MSGCRSGRWIAHALMCALVLAVAAGCMRAEPPATSPPPPGEPVTTEPPRDGPPHPPPPAPEPETEPLRPMPAPPPPKNGAGQPLALPDFPWPPPRYSAFQLLERAWLAPQAGATLGSAARHLEAAFDAAGYVERSYYRVPGGFALASRAEQIHDDASPYALPQRWSVDESGTGKGFADRLRALFNAPPGRYRVIVFVVTDQDFAAAPRAPTGPEAGAWVTSGGLRLPQAIAVQAYTPSHYASALIYEFERRSTREAAEVRTPGVAPGRVHLEKGGLWQALAAD